MNKVELPPIRESIEDYEALEKKILVGLRKEIYLPLIKEFGGSKSILNSLDDVLSAIRSGKISFNRGKFTGKFSAGISKQLKAMGAKWTGNGFSIPSNKLTPEIKHAVSLSESRLTHIIARISSRLYDMLPEKIAESFDLTHLFDKTLWRVDRSFNETLKSITVPPVLTEERRAVIAKEYSENMKLYIKGWAEKEIVDLRQKMQDHSFTGLRYEGIVKTIQKSYGVSQSKAKFLARQETGLLMAKFKKARYSDAGVYEYKWGCAAGSKGHPVRPMHKALEGKVFRWDSPPITNVKGQRNNPGEDFGCRCFARPIVKF